MTIVELVVAMLLVTRMAMKRKWYAVILLIVSNKRGSGGNVCDDFVFVFVMTLMTIAIK